jgi:ABC-type polar amino acid transport system ATPase subunit
MIDLQHVSKSFNGVTVLDDVSLQVKKGETIIVNTRATHNNRLS